MAGRGAQGHGSMGHCAHVPQQSTEAVVSTGAPQATGRTSKLEAAEGLQRDVPAGPRVMYRQAGPVCSAHVRLVGALGRPGMNGAATKSNSTQAPLPIQRPGSMHVVASTCSVPTMILFSGAPNYRQRPSRQPCHTDTESRGMRRSHRQSRPKLPVVACRLPVVSMQHQLAPSHGGCGQHGNHGETKAEPGAPAVQPAPLALRGRAKQRGWWACLGLLWPCTICAKPTDLGADACPAAQSREGGRDCAPIGG